MTPARHRMAALGLLGVVAALALATVLGPLVGLVRSEIEQRGLLTREASKLQGLKNAEPELQRLVAAVDAHPLWQRIYRGGGIADTQAALQKDFRQLAEAQGITVDALQPLDPAAAGPFTAIALRVSFNTTIDHFSQLLAAMEAAPHAVRFENLYVTAPMSQTGTGNAPLVVRGDVLAYFDPESGP